LAKKSVLFAMNREVVLLSLDTPYQTTTQRLEYQRQVQQLRHQALRLLVQQQVRLL